MALSYGLEIATELKPIQALQIVADKCSLEWQQETLRGPGIQVIASEEEEDDQSLTEEAFGFRPSVFLGFRVNPGKNLEKAERTVIRATMALLQQVAGDAVLMFNYESIVLQRISNQLVFNQEMWERWTASEMANTTVLYELKELPSPLL